MAALSIADPQALLREVFGHADFRPGQREAVEAALAGRDALVVMPTGSGKSLCYQLPALAGDGLTLVVSPLVALMADQVAALRRLGRADVAALSSHSSADELADTFAAIADHSLRLLYVAPERFASGRFATALARVRVSLLVVDEAHCLSEWGHDFRPDYGRLATVRESLGTPTTMALTATATPRVALDVIRRLQLHEPTEVRTGFDRPNLTFDVLHTSGDRHRRELLAAGLADPALRPAIVYARSRRAADQIGAELGCLVYHAGLSATARTAAQEAFMASDDAVVACTNAFGMGVDKANVRSVWHWNLPNSLEAYYQEAGRAGRDGDPARCVLLYAPGDRGIIGRFIVGARFGCEHVDRLVRTLAQTADPRTKEFVASPGELARLCGARDDDARAWLAAAEAVGALELAPGGGSVWRGTLRLRGLGGDSRAAVDARARAVERTRWEQLDSMQRYAESETCRRETVLAYFGDHRQGEPSGRCCDVCSPPGDATRRPPPPPDDVVAAVCELAASAAPSLGRTGLDGVLRGLGSYRDAYAAHPLFGACGRLRPVAVRTAIAAAVEAGRLVSSEGAYPVLLPPGATRRRGEPSSAPRRERRTTPTVDDDPRVEALRAWRRQAATDRAVPAYVVAHDATLLAIGAARPRSSADLLAIRGIGPAFVERHGEAVLAILRESP